MLGLGSVLGLWLGSGSGLGLGLGLGLRLAFRDSVSVRDGDRDTVLTWLPLRSQAAGGADRPLEPWEKELLAKVEAADKGTAAPTK